MDEPRTQQEAAETHSARSAAALRELEGRARASLASGREQAALLEARIAGQLEAVAAALAAEKAADSQSSAEADQLRAEAGQLRAEVERLTRELEESQAASLLQQSELEASRDQLQQQASELEAARDQLQRQVAELEAGRDQLQQQVLQLEVSEKSARDDWAHQLGDFENKLREQQAAWNQQRAEWNQTHAASEQDRAALQQKFELALRDVQRFRERVAELEQELARRPESQETDSAELVALRAERDALAERIEELENQPSAPVDASAEQQLADLQRRFELAVEDVRELKTANAQLESRLAAAGKNAIGAADPGGLDWESQKRRLLASLEDEGDDADDGRRKDERVRIEGTIEMTDAVVAEKDRQIAELQAQLAELSAGGSAKAEEERDQKTRELIDADELIAEHRRRAAELEREMEEKLRAAELELSIERAKIARERVELDELRADLESQRNAMGTGGAAATPGAPRRRWLSKLGLNGEE